MEIAVPVSVFLLRFEVAASGLGNGYVVAFGNMWLLNPK